MQLVRELRRSIASCSTVFQLLVAVFQSKQAKMDKQKERGLSAVL